MRRLLVTVTVVATLALPATFSAFALSSPASAASGVSCQKLTGTITGDITISKCTPKSKTNKTASGLAVSLASSGTLTWSKSGQTTNVTLSTSSPGQGACKAGSTEYDVTGTVTGGTSTYTQSGDAVSGKACVTSGGSLSLVKKSVMTL
jgi:hypothetical protein